MTDFVHLHVHSDFSLLDAAAPVMGLADRAEELGMTHLALTDHGNMFGVMEFLAACEETINKEGRHEKRKNPVKPIVGCEVYVSPTSRLEKKGSESENRYYHLILLAMNREGYHNLVKLCSFAYTEGFYYRPRIDEELLAKHHAGLIALSACVSGEIPRLIQAGKRDEAEKKALYYRGLFGDDENGNPNFYLEIQDHGITAEWFRGAMSQMEINRALIDIAKRTGIPLVATNDVHYLRKEDSVAHDILLCIGTAQTRNAEKRKKRYFGDNFYLKSGDEMAALFPDCPEAIANTVRIAERCNADIPKIKTKDLPKYLPDFEIPLGYGVANSVGAANKVGVANKVGDTNRVDAADAYLRHLAMEGAGKRYAKQKNENGEAWRLIKERTEYELNTIIQMGFTGYFLIVADFINWAKEHDIPVGPGRGSGAGSIVAYSLRITDIDPLKYNLLFERFLNPERISMPDFDVDFANEGREDVINYVTEKYGRNRVGQIITFGTLGAKAVIKDVARTLNISIPESDMITKLIPRDPKITLPKAIKEEPKLQELEQDPRYTELFELARKLEGLNRHSSIHAAGMVIGKSELNNFVPLFKDSKTGIIATQYSMNYLEPCGLVKMDFLGLKTLDVIKNTEELIRQRGGEFADFSVSAAPEDDEATFRMLGEGKSFEIFQFESDGMQSVLKRARPNSIEDLTALNSLYRPGPMDNIDQFVDSKNGRQAIRYPDPSLEGILKETYGVIVYQEQVMQVAQIVAGFTLGHADELRRAMGKKIMEKMVKEKAQFIAGARERGYSEEKATEIFELLIPFAGYGFNKSHAAAYSVVAYHTAYLKANFPAEFMAANLTNEINSANKDKLSECISEARKMGLAIDPPDINRSGKIFTIVDGRIVFALLGIKGLGDGPSEEIVNRRKEGPYKHFMDFLDRVDVKAVGKSVIEKLIQTGAFDNLGTSRETLLGNLERAVEYTQNIKDGKMFGQGSLFENTGEKEYQDFEFEKFPEIGREDKLKIEKELIGFYFSGHPMDEYRGLWQSLVKVNLGNPETLISGNQILVGLVKNIKLITTSRGDKMAFASLEDYNGEIEITFFSGAWEKCKDSLEPDKVAILKGKIDYQQSRDKRSFIAEECLEADEAEKLSKADEARSRKWDKYRNIWKYAAKLELRIPDLAEQDKVEPGTYTVLGMIKSLRTHKDKKDKEMAFGTIEDFRGEIDLVFFSRTWENCKALTAVDEVVALKGTIEPARDKAGKMSFVVSSVQDLNKLLRAAAKKAAEMPESSEKSAEEAFEAPAGSMAAKKTKESESALYREIHIRLAASAANNEAALNSLKRRLYENPGNCPVFIHVPAFSPLGATYEVTTTKGSSSETVIRTANQINAGLPLSDLSPEKCAAVADVWGK